MNRVLGASRLTVVVLVLLAGGCSSAGVEPSPEAAAAIDMAVLVDAAILADSASLSDADTDGGDACFVSTVGVFGTCMTTVACAALGGHVSTPGFCAGPAEIECCTRALNVSDNAPVPAGWKLMAQADVTPDDDVGRADLPRPGHVPDVLVDDANVQRTLGDGARRVAPAEFPERPRASRGDAVPAHLSGPGPAAERVSDR